VKLLDFGIAKLYGGETNEGRDEFVGTPDYASPEQACARPEIDYRSDIYSLGVVAYEMLTGTLPLQGATPMATLQKHVDDLPAPPSAHVVLPVQVDALVMHMLAKDPAARPSLDEIRDALREFVEPHTGKIVLPAEPLPEAPRRTRTVLPFVGATMAASISIAFGLSHHAVASHATMAAHAGRPPVEIVSQPAQRFAAERSVTAPPVETTVAPPTIVPPARRHVHRHATARRAHTGIDYLLGYDGKQW